MSPSSTPSASARPTIARNGNRRRRPPAAGPRVSTAPRVRAVSDLESRLAESLRSPVPPAQTFGALGLPAPVVAALAEQGRHEPFAIQARVLPDALAGRDVLGRAQTGSGKTLAFGLPMLTRIRPATDRDPRGLVLVPTRELAQQVADELAPIARALKLSTAVVVGGVSIGKQITTLRRGVDILIATPGRLIDLLDRRDVRLDRIEIVALDEADHMADLGFLPAVTRVLQATPEQRQNLLFSATLDGGVDKLVDRFLTDPAVHAVAPATAVIDSMSHRVFVMPHEKKVEVAAQVAARPARTLFFVRTKHGADRLARQMSRHGTDSIAIHGNLNQNQRTRALDAFTSGRSRVLVATDVAARGLHIDDVDLVVHFDPPQDHKAYLHRSGRTARAGASGTALSFVTPEQRREVSRLHEAAGVRPEVLEVSVGHPAVRGLAASGTPVPVRSRVAPADARPAPARPRRRDGRRGARR